MGVPHASYPRGALVPVQVVEVNTLRHSVKVPKAQGFQCSDAIVRVYTAGGSLLYPPIFADEPFENCPQYVPTIRIASRASYSWHQWVILKGPTLRLGAANPALARQQEQPSFALRLSQGTGQLSVTFRRTPSLRAVLAGAKLQHIEYYGWTTCTGGLTMTSNSGSGFGGWQAAHGDAIAGTFRSPDSHELTSRCPGHATWHIVAGIPGQPVVYARYDSAHPS